MSYLSDRGLQYSSYKYLGLLSERGIKISTNEKASPQQNAIAERVNGILKHELELKSKFKTYQDAKLAANKAIRKYNSIRPHANCDYLTPDQAHQENIEMKKRWKDYTEKRQSILGFSSNVKQ